MNSCNISHFIYSSIRFRSLWKFVVSGALIIYSVNQSVAGCQEIHFRDYFPQIESADWEEISRGCPIDHEENGTLTRILDGLENIPEPFWKAAAESNTTTIANAIAAPAENCGKVFSLSGKCVQAQPPWNFKRYSGGTGFVDVSDYQSHGQRILLACRDGSEAWVMAHFLPQPVRLSFPDQPRVFIDHLSCMGMFLFAENDRPVFVTRQVHWRPTTESPDLNIGKGQLELVRAGFDIELLGRVRNYTDMALLPEEKELFDGILIAARTISQQPDFTLQGLAKSFDLVDLIQQPNKNAGSLIQVDGTLRRFTSVAIDDPDLRKELGENKYYQLDVFVPLGNKRIHIGNDKREKPIEVTGEYGITVITSSLPDEILNARLPVPIEVPAFMLKVWEHTSLATSTASGTVRRPNPILIAIPSQLRIAPPSEIASELFILIPSIGFGTLGILGILFFVTRNRVQTNRGRQGLVEDPDFAVLFKGEQDESPRSP